MDIIARAIPTIAYNAHIPVGSFRYKDWRVILDRREIMVKDIQKDADAAEVMDYLKVLYERPGSSGACNNGTASEC